MDFERLNGDIKEMRRRNQGLGLAVAVLAAGQILALIVIFNLLGTVRTVVVPPSIDKTFWVTRDRASSEYLEQMGSFIAWLVLDVTPASIDLEEGHPARLRRTGTVRPAENPPGSRSRTPEAHQRRHRLRPPATGSQ